MHFPTIIALAMASAASCYTIPDVFARSNSCLKGSAKHAGDSCEAPNYNAQACGPGNKGNVLLCVKNKNDDDYHWQVDVRCKSGSGGGCHKCKCRLGSD